MQDESGQRQGAPDDLEAPARDNAVRKLSLAPADLAGARRVNAVLSVLPRFHTGRRWNAGVVQALVRLCQALPDRQHGPVATSVLRIPGSSSSLRLTHPAGVARALLLHFHGGAWIMGNARLEDRLARATARASGLLVAAVDFPNATDDDLSRTVDACIAASRWVATHLDAFGLDRMLISGESSGAHLAMEALLDLRAEGRHHLVRGFYATCGAFDLDGSPRLRTSNEKTLLIDGRSAFDNLRRLQPSLPRHLRHGPLYADLADLPPALLIAGARDPIRDDSLAMSARWNAANGNAELLLVPEGVHGFNRLPTRLAARTNRFARQWMGQRIDDTDIPSTV
jgi:acetyl esterase/lipase